MIKGAFVLNYKALDERIYKYGFKELFFSLDTPIELLKDMRRKFRIILEFKPFESNGKYITNIYNEKEDLKALSCPTDIENWERNIEKLREKLSYVDAIALDFVRFPSFSNGKFFLSCFCKNCERFAKDLRYDFNILKDSVIKFLKLDLKGASLWFEYRRKVLEEYLKYIKKRINIEVRAFVFTPTLSYFVGQDYKTFLNYLHKLHPMIYPEGNLGPACIGYEIYHFSKLLNIDVSKVYEILNINIPNLPRTREDLYEKGMPNDIIRYEIEKCKIYGMERIEPIITCIKITSDELKIRLDKCKEANVKYIHLFGYPSEAIFCLSL